MAITLDTIVNKVFKVVKNGYDNNEVEQFLDEILEEMENREAETEKLKKQIAEMTEQRAAAKTASASAPAVQTAPVQHSAESFELVLSKAKSAYEEIVAAADTRAAEIVKEAETKASSIREDAKTQIADLTEKLASLRKQTSEYYASLKKIVDTQNASMEQLKKLL